ncbi:MAG: isochorismatase family cysteine hydrolase [Chloroflexota bacterium]
MATGREIIADTQPFFEWLAGWYDALEPAGLADVLPQPGMGAILAADLIVGFCSEGPLASPRIQAIVPATVDLLRKAHAAGVTRFVLAQDTHAPNTPEFQAYPPHCLRGTREADMVPELAKLPFADHFTIIEKNSLSVAVGTRFHDWLTANDDITDYVVTGDCTDLCTYQMAMYVRLWANASNRPDITVWVDAAAVDTFDIPVSAAGDAVLPHPGNFSNMYFLYHMALNGIRIISGVH